MVKNKKLNKEIDKFLNESGLIKELEKYSKTIIMIHNPLTKQIQYLDETGKILDFNTILSNNLKKLGILETAKRETIKKLKTKRWCFIW